MCLYAENIEGEISDKPITCYKVYKKREGGTMEAYYTRVKYDLKEGDEVIAEGDEYINRDSISSEYWRIERGFLHALFWEYDLLGVGYGVCHLCVEVLRSIEFNSHVDEMLDKLLRALNELCWCEMEIPAGERYWIEEGRAGMMVERDICARRMFFKKEFKIGKKSEILNMIRVIYSDCFVEDTYERISDLIDEYKTKGE